MKLKIFTGSLNPREARRSGETWPPNYLTHTIVTKPKNLIANFQYLQLPAIKEKIIHDLTGKTLNGPQE